MKIRSSRIAILAFLFVPAVVPQTSPPAPGAPVTLRTTGMGWPWINFQDGIDLAANSVSAASISSLSSLPSSAVPRSLTAGDFDENGAPDVLSGFALSSGGRLMLHLGRADSLSPLAISTQTSGALVPEMLPFVPGARTFDLPSAPDFLGSGDFNADGHLDVVFATRGTSAIFVLPGDGHGGFGPVQRIELPGAVTALCSGEINRPDGLSDIVVAVKGVAGPQVLVFESPQGAAQAEPEVFPLPEEATALALGHFSQKFTVDLAVAAGRQLVMIEGRDRRLSLDDTQQAEVPPARVSQLSFPLEISSLAAGEFTGGNQTELAALVGDGDVYLVQTSAVGPAGDANAIPQNVWQSKLLTAAAAKWGTQLVPARVSGGAADDLLLVDAPAHQIGIWTSMGTAAPVASQGEPVALLPIPLQSSAVPDLVVLQSGSTAPTLVMAAPMPTNPTFIVSDASDRPCLDVKAPNCGQPAPFTISLREAIQLGNARDIGSNIRIIFSIAPRQPARIILTAPLPPIQNRTDIDGATQVLVPPSSVSKFPPITLDGANAGPGAVGLDLVASNNFVQGLEIDGFDIGIRLRGSNNVVVRNAIGTGPRGNGVGVVIRSAKNVVGNNIISGSQRDGVSISAGATGNIIHSNFIGLGLDGTSPRPNRANGIIISGASNNIIGDSSGALANVISGNGKDGISITADLTGPANGNRVQGNCLGINADLPANFLTLTRTGSTTVATVQDSCFRRGAGTLARVAVPNGLSGVFINDANNTIGGGPGGNIVSGNTASGVAISGASATGNLMQGNFIGTDASGLAALTGAPAPIFGSPPGVAIDNAPGNIVGGVVTFARNLISGNTGDGIQIAGNLASGNMVQGNFIGIDRFGSTALPNGTASIFLAGVKISGKSGKNTIGGSARGAGNVISGNQGDGILILNLSGGGAGNTVQGNLIGTDQTGTSAVGNTSSGINVNSSDTNLIGGTMPGEGNVISGNLGDGIFIFSSKGNTVAGNFIGTDRLGFRLLGNSQNGVIIDNVLLGDRSGNQIGPGNTIANNRKAGVSVTFGDRQLITQNSIFDNSTLGIDLGGTGTMRPIVPCNVVPDLSPNNFQNFPMLTSARSSAVGTTVSGMLNSFPPFLPGFFPEVYTIEFFSNPASSLGATQGRMFIGSTTVGTSSSSANPKCTGTFSASFSIVVPAGQFITATATSRFNDTSEFSTPIKVGTGQPTTATVVDSIPLFGPSPVFGQPVTFTATISSPALTIPTGTVQFRVDGEPLGGPLILNAAGVATSAPATPAAGSHFVTADYSGDANFDPSSGNLPEEVLKASTFTTTSFFTAQNPSIFGVPVTFFADVTAVAPGAGTPTGTATFFDGAATLGKGTLDGFAEAQLTTPFLTVPESPHLITARYDGDANFKPSNTFFFPIFQVVKKADTATGISSTVNPSVFGQAVSFAAPVTRIPPGAGAPTGAVMFSDGALSLGSGTLSGGVAGFTTASLAVGNHAITARYGGDPNFNAGPPASIAQTVNKAATVTVVTSSLNPSRTGASVTFTAQVSVMPPGAGMPTGTVTFLDGGTTLGTGTLTAGTATFTSSTLAAGSHPITAAYQGDGNFQASTSPALSQTVSDLFVQLTTRLNQLNRDNVTGDIVAMVVVSNSGTLAATGVQLTGSTLNGTPSSTVFPTAVGDIAPGGSSSSVELRFPGSVGASGTAGVLRIDGTYSGGTFGGGFRTVVP